MRQQRSDREVAQSMPYWATNRTGIDNVPAVRQPVPELRRDDDDIDFDYVSDNENEIEFEQLDEDHGDDDLIITPVVHVSLWTELI